VYAGLEFPKGLKESNRYRRPLCSTKSQPRRGWSARSEPTFAQNRPGLPPFIVNSHDEVGNKQLKMLCASRNVGACR